MKDTMDRPRSMIGTPGVSHKRNASSLKSISRVQAPSAAIDRPQAVNTVAAPAVHSEEKETIQLFLNNLKLLGLHTLKDWPAMTVKSFGNHDSRTRLRCSEWSLYQLFRLYDLHTTADKLQPFFPPLEPLQSVNLRAALYRCLTELKKNGVLGRETVLRKTMLDECSGEKFWDLCLTFSGTVLKHVTAGRSQRYLPVAQKLATAHALTKRERESLLPLAVAHKSALTRVLSQKHHRRQSYIHVFDSMKEKEDELARRKHIIETQPSIVESDEHANELEMIAKEIAGDWTNDESFKDAIVNGDPAKPDDHMLLQTTHEFLAGIGRNEPLDTRRDSGVLEDIELQARAQNARVKEWQAWYAKLQADRRSSISSRDRTKPNADVVFNRHHDLNVDDVQPSPVKSMVQPEPMPSYVSKYDEILTSMREELRRTQINRREAVAKHTSPVRKPSITLNAIAGASQPPLSRSVSRRSISPSFPLRPDMARRASSRTRSYQQPKVISQREFIPLKSEIFSPLRRTGSVSPASGRSSVAGTPIEEHSPIVVDASGNGQLSKRSSLNSVVTSTVDSGIGLGVDLTESPIEAGTCKDEFKKPSVPTRSVSFAHRKSLSERTRLSMSFTRLEDDPTETIAPAQLSDTSQQPASLQGLAARTRQSMAGVGMPLPVRVSPSTSHSRASSVAQPLVPSRQRPDVRQTSKSFSGADSLEPVPVEEAKQRNITPRERLFDADAEYNSIFRSRPKIATSPPSSPVKGEEHGAMMAQASVQT